MQIGVICVRATREPAPLTSARLVAPDDIRSYLATAVKHAIRFIDALTMLAEHRPWLPAHT